MARVLLISLFDEYAMGLRYIASSLLASGHQPQLVFLKQFAQLHAVPHIPGDTTRVAECPFYVAWSDVDLILGEINSHKPDIIGISLVSSLFGLACVLTDRIRARFPRVPIVWGGIEPTVDPDLAQEHADIVCVGEGERAMVLLASLYSKEQRGSEGPWWYQISTPIDNLRIRQEAGFLTGEEGLMIPDLDSLPFALFDLNRETYINDGVVYRGAYPPECRLNHGIAFLSGRGCAFQCSYCANSVLKKIYHGGPYHRRRSPEKVIEEIKLRLKQFPNLQILEVEDDVFTLEKSWVERFTDLYKEIHIPFWCYTFPGFNDESIMRRLREVGLISVTFGIQSGSQRVLEEVYNRRATPDKIRLTAELLHRLEIPYVVDLIGSNPLETDEDRALTVSLLTSLPKPYLLHPINPITFYRGYPITELAMNKGVRLIQNPGTTKYGPEEDPRYASWDAVMTLAHYPGVDSEMLKPLWECDALMNDPKALTGLARAFALAVYHNGDIYCTKEKRIAQLEKELAEIKGSRLVQKALEARDFLARMR